MKVLLVNGSPHREGCTYTALCEAGDALNTCGVDTDVIWIGNRPLSGCIACHKCAELNRCVFQDAVNDFLEIAGDYDGFVFGSPVHWAGATGALTSFLNRAFYADLNGGGDRFYLKPAAAVISARRAGTSSASCTAGAPMLASAMAKRPITCASSASTCSRSSLLRRM